MPLDFRRVATIILFMAAACKARGPSLSAAKEASSTCQSPTCANGATVDDLDRLVAKLNQEIAVLAEQLDVNIDDGRSAAGMALADQSRPMTAAEIQALRQQIVAQQEELQVAIQTAQARLQKVVQESQQFNAQSNAIRIQIAQSLRATADALDAVSDSDAGKISESLRATQDAVERLRQLLCRLDQSCPLTATLFDSPNLEKAAWGAFTPPPFPSRHGHVMVAVGNRMLLWGGLSSEKPSTFTKHNDGALFDPATSRWTPIPPAPALEPRHQSSAAVTANLVAIWGGEGATKMLSDGSILNVADGSWQTIATAGAPSPRRAHVAAMIGRKMFIWSGWSGNSALNDGAIYDLDSASWSPVGTANAPSKRWGATAVVIGGKIFVWGGDSPQGKLSDGGVFDLASNTWEALSAPADIVKRGWHAAVVSGSKMIVFGGQAATTHLNDLIIYDTQTGLWRNIGAALPNTPTPRRSHAAALLANRFYVWGGIVSAANVEDSGVFGLP